MFADWSYIHMLRCLRIALNETEDDFHGYGGTTHVQLFSHHT